MLILFSCAGYAKNVSRKDRTVANYIESAKQSIQDKQFENAIEFCNKALQLNPESVEAYNQRGNAYYNEAQIQRGD